MSTSPEKFEKVELPEMCDAILSMEEIEALFSDLEQCVELIGITIKQTGQQYAPEARENVTLHIARLALDEPSTHGLQLRYNYEGSLWIDAITRCPEGFRLFRVKHS